MSVGICGFPLGNRLFDELGTVTSSLSQGVVSAFIPSAGLQQKDVRAFQLDARATHGNSGGPVFSWETGRVFGVLQGGIPGLVVVQHLEQPRDRFREGEFFDLWARPVPASLPPVRRNGGKRRRGIHLF